MANNPASQRKSLLIVVGVLVASAVILPLALTQVPLFVRLAIAGSDLIVAAILWVFVQQKFPRPKL